MLTKSFFGSLCTQCWFARLVGPRTSTTSPSSRRTRTCATPFPVCSSCCNRTSPCLMSLRSQNLCWFSQPLRFSQRWAMSAGNEACSPRDFAFLYCGAEVLSVHPPVWSRSSVPASPYRLSAVAAERFLLVPGSTRSARPISAAYHVPTFSCTHDEG